MASVVGQSVKRREDAELLRGDARFTADISLPGMLHMAILRSPHGHAAIRGIDATEALKMPGVVRIVTGAELDGKIMPLPCVWIPGGVESHFPPHPYGVPGAGNVLATDRVRFHGDPVAVAVAETADQAYDAIGAIEVDYDPLPVVVDAEKALEDGAPQLHETVQKNLNAYWTCGDRDAAERAIADADVVVSQKIVNQRTVNSPIEPRASIGSYDAGADEYTLWSTTQSPHNHRLLLAYMVLGIPFNKLRVIGPNVGGSFGTKGYLYPDMALVLFLAKEIGRPVKWVDTRTGLFHSTVQGRDQVQYGTLAGTKDGRIIGLRCTSYANLGAYPSTIGPGVVTALMGRSITGVYAIPAAFCEVSAVFTNVVPLGAQRGSGRAEATLLVERLIDQYAMDIGKDPAEVRRRNLVPPDRFPYDNGLGWVYDSGNYEPALDRALEMVGYRDLEARKLEARKRGKRLGIGIGCFVAICGVGPSPRMGKEGMLGGTWESAAVRVHPTGEIEVIVGSKPHGQSHETVFAQIVAEELGVGVDQVEVLHSDTERSPYGQGTYGSRSLSVGGSAVHLTAVKIREKAIASFAHTFEVAEADVEYRGGRLSVRGAPDRTKTLQEVAMDLWYGWNIPRGMEPNLEATTFFDPPDFNYPFGAHAAVVEIDEVTGKPELVQYVAVNDVGTAINPMVVEGQMHGSIAHGVGQALLERAVFAKDGQLVTDSFMTYALPRATHLPNFQLDWTVTPTPHNPLGAKGAGEIGTVPAAAAIVNAVCNALADLGVRHVDMPVTAEKIWRILRDGHPGRNGHGARTSDGGREAPGRGDRDGVLTGERTATTATGGANAGARHIDYSTVDSPTMPMPALRREDQ